MPGEPRWDVPEIEWGFMNHCFIGHNVVNDLIIILRIQK